MIIALFLCRAHSLNTPSLRVLSGKMGIMAMPAS